MLRVSVRGHRESTVTVRCFNAVADEKLSNLIFDESYMVNPPGERSVIILKILDLPCARNVPKPFHCG